MEENNPYKRRYKTKNEQYQEKLRQRSNSQDWLFGNMFGKPGGGAPLRDNQGNIISHLKTINNDNIYKYQPDYFSKGNNNISLLNYNANNPRNITTTPNTFQNNQTNLLSQRNQSISFQENNINNQFLHNNNKFNINNPLLLNQRQIPFGYTIIPLQNIIPLYQIYPLQRNNNLPYYFKSMTTTPSMNNRTKMITPSINYMNKSQNISNEKQNNINKDDYKVDNSTEVNNTKINENEEDNLFISNDNDRNNRLQSEKKLEEWKIDLKKQMEEKQKRKEEAKRKEMEEDKEEERKYKEFLLYKNKQNEENKKNKSKLKKIRYQQSQNQSNIELDKTNNNVLEQSQPSKVNNEIQNVPVEEFEDEPYNQNNPLNEYNITPEMIKEQENLKNYIDDQYDSLGDVLKQNIQSEIDKMSSKLIKNYDNYLDEEKLKLLGASKYTNVTAERNNKRVQKLHDIIEERNLLNFIIGRDDNNFSTIKYQNYDINKYNKLSSKMPSYFGKNVIPYENVDKQLNSEGRFIYGDYSNTWKEKENNDIFRQKELKYIENGRDIDKFYKNNINRKFGKNKNENVNAQSLDFSQSLDNKSSFVPLDKNEVKKHTSQNYNIINDNLREINKQRNSNIVDPVEENIIKNLNEIDKLNKKVILYNKDGTEIKENNDVHINKQTNQNHINNKLINEKSNNRNEENNEINENNNKN